MDSTESDYSPEVPSIEGFFADLLGEVPAGDDDLMVTGDIDSVIDEPIQILAQTSGVKFYSVSCTSGTTTSTFGLPVTAFNWHARFGFFRADWSRIALSGTAHWPRSFYAGTVLKVRFPGRLPSGTKDLRAYWWYGSAQDGTLSEVWWNRIRTNC